MAKEWFYIVPPKETVEKKKGKGPGYHGPRPGTGRKGKVGGSLPRKGSAAKPKVSWDPTDLPPQWTTTMHDKDGLIKPEAVGKAVARAVKERPSRATHGYTGKNAFFIINNKVVPWNEYSKLSAAERKQAIPTHSHGSENWKWWTKKQKRLEGFQPHNSEDIYLWLKDVPKQRMSTASALIMPDGRMEILEILPSTDPKVFKLGRKRLQKLVEPTQDEVGARLKKNPAITTNDVAREKVRQFAKKYGLHYTDDVTWRTTPELEKYGKK